MICPRCSNTELIGDSQQCPRCGHSSAGGVTVAVAGPDPVDEVARREFAELFAIELLHRRGPASSVYVARDLEWDQRVALKVMARSPEAGVHAEEAFHRAVATAATLDHLHVAPIYSASVTPGFFSYSMKFVAGRSLAELLRERGLMELHECLRIVEQVATALDYAHRGGVVHADLNPANVLIDASGWLYVTDFWVPRVLDQLGALAGGKTRRPEYLAPEEFSAGQPGAAADQYSLAMLVYECLSGKLPFTGDAAEVIAARHRAEPPPRLSDVRPDLPPHVGAALERAMSKAPGARFAGVLDFVAGLEAPAPLSLRPAAAAGPNSAAAPAPPVLSQPPQPPQPPQPRPQPSRAPRKALGVGSGGGGNVEPPAPRRLWLRLGAVALALLSAVGTVLLVRSEWKDLQTTASTGAVPPPVWRDTARATVRSDSALERRPHAPMRSADPAPAPVPAPERSAPPAQPSPPARAPVTTDSVARRPAPQSGRLFINATPWGLVYLDGVLIGNTPKTDVSVAPGTHSLRVVRDGFEPFERTLRVGPGEDVRLTDIVLRGVKR